MHKTKFYFGNNKNTIFFQKVYVQWRGGYLDYTFSFGLSLLVS